MELKPITGSSSVREIGYDPDKREMEVMFAPRGNYLYKDISKEEYETIVNAGSVGNQLRITVKGKECINLRLI